MSTGQKVFSDLISNFLNSYHQHLSQWLADNKDIEISPEELSSAFDIEFKVRNTGLPQAANVATQMPNIPGYYAGATPPKRRGGRRKKVVDPNAPRCSYLFTRGKKVGKECGEPALNDGSPLSDQYCKQCIKKTAVKKLISEGGTGTSSNTVKPPMLPGNRVAIPDTEKEPAASNVDAVPIPGTDNLFKLTNGDFIVQRQADGGIVAIAKEDENGQQRPLTMDEKIELQAIGISVLASPEVSPAQRASQVEVPQIPNVAAVPQIPNIPSMGAQSMTI